MPRQPAAPRKPAVTKIFVLDTNVLMHDPSCLYRFEEHDIFLPIMTLEELDNNKKGMSEIARNARQASRMLDEMLGHDGVDIEEGGAGDVAFLVGLTAGAGPSQDEAAVDDCYAFVACVRLEPARLYERVTTGNQGVEPTPPSLASAAPHSLLAPS